MPQAQNLAETPPGGGASRFIVEEVGMTNCRPEFFRQKDRSRKTVAFILSTHYEHP